MSLKAGDKVKTKEPSGRIWEVVTIDEINDSIMLRDSSLSVYLEVNQLVFKEYYEKVSGKSNELYCEHSWKEYQGFTESFNYCEKCGEKSMLKNFTREEMMEFLKKDIEAGYIKEENEYYSLTNKGVGRMMEYMYDFVDVMMQVDAYKNYPQSHLLQITMESLQQTFGSKLTAFLMLNNTDWKKDIKRQMEMPLDELMRELGMTENEIKEYTTGTSSKQKLNSTNENKDNVIAFDKNKKDTLH